MCIFFYSGNVYYWSSDYKIILLYVMQFGIFAVKWHDTCQLLCVTYIWHILKYNSLMCGNFFLLKVSFIGL